MSYRVEFLSSALRELSRITEPFRSRIIDRVERLADDPRPSGAKKLHGHAAMFRIRIGDYRVVYEVADAIRIVTVTRVGHRRDVYRGL